PGRRTRQGWCDASAARGGIDDVARRILARVAPIEADLVLDDPSFGQLMDWRRIRIVFTKNVDADFDLLQVRIVERLERQAFVPAVHENVCRTGVRPGRANESVSRWRADHDVAAPLFQRGVHCVANEAPPLRPP